MAHTKESQEWHTLHIKGGGEGNGQGKVGRSGAVFVPTPPTTHTPVQIKRVILYLPPLEHIQPPLFVWPLRLRGRDVLEDCAAHLGGGEGGGWGEYKAIG